MRRFADYDYPWTLKRRLRPVVRTIRYRSVTTNDTVLASYPRSGSTWLRFLLTDLVTGEDAEWPTVNRTVPDVGTHADDAPAFLPGDGRLIKTHDRRRAPARRAVYLVRDVRDVLLSEHRSRLRAGATETVEEFLEQAMSGSLSLFGSWEDHVRYWLDTGRGDSDSLHLMKFEDMRVAPLEELQALLRFLGLSFGDDAISVAIERNDLRRMKEKEERVLDREITRYGKERFVGEGAVGGWSSKLEDHQIRRIEDENRTVLGLLGYPLGEPR